MPYSQAPVFQDQISPTPPIVRVSRIWAIASWLTIAPVWAFGIGQGFTVPPANAQIIADTTLSTTVTSPDNLNFVIEGGDRPQNGPNLFHSFDTFSVPDGGSAQFQNATDITHIIGRVTGTQPSVIEGLIQAEGDANLFLINPQGIVFGPNAQLDIGGSFLASTAEQMVFDDGTAFRASDRSTIPLLTVSAPIGLQMGPDPQSIQHQSQGAVGDEAVGLSLKDRETLGLIGGAIALDGGLITTPSGRVELGGLGPNQWVNLTQTTRGYELNYDDATQFADVVLTNGAGINTSGVRSGAVQIQGNVVHLTNGSSIEANNLGRRKGGAIALSGRTLLIDHQGNIVSRSLGNGDGASIYLTATDSIRFVGPGYDQFITDVQNFITGTETSINILYTVAQGQGSAGNVQLIAPELWLLEGGAVGSNTRSSGNSGQINLEITDRIEAHSSSLATNAAIGSTGDSGNVHINTNVLKVKDGQQISSSAFGIGNAGAINITATTITLKDSRTQFPTVINLPVFEAATLTSFNSATLGAGQSGQIRIQAQTLSLEGGTLITSATLGAQNAGDIMIDTDVLRIEGSTPRPDLSIRTGISSATLGAGNAGDIHIQTQRLSLQDGNLIDSSSVNSGNAGNVTIVASEQVLVQGQSPFSNIERLESSTISSRAGFPTVITAQTPEIEAQNLGNAGNIEITTPLLAVAEGGMISISAEGRGDIGVLAIAAPTLSLNGGAIVATSDMGQGGDITIEATTLILLQNDSFLSTRAGTANQTAGGGDGGNITLQSPLLLGFGNSDIIANAFQGDGGQISIETQGLFGLTVQDRFTDDSDIMASSASGVSGTIAIITPDVVPGTDAMILPTAVANPTENIATTCDITNGSQFIMTNRGGLPVDPDGDGDRPWTHILPDFGIIPNTLPSLLIPHSSLTSPTSPAPSTSPAPAALREATQMAIAPNGTIQLVNATTYSQALQPICAASPS